MPLLQIYLLHRPEEACADGLTWKGVFHRGGMNFESVDASSTAEKSNWPESVDFCTVYGESKAATIQILLILANHS